MLGFNRRKASRNRPTSTTSPNESLCRRLARCQLRLVSEVVAQLPEPRQGGVFDDGFGEAYFSGNDSR